MTRLIFEILIFKYLYFFLICNRYYHFKYGYVLSKRGEHQIPLFNFPAQIKGMVAGLQFSEFMLLMETMINL
jgi:hypothetical protein